MREKQFDYVLLIKLFQYSKDEKHLLVSEGQQHFIGSLKTERKKNQLQTNYLW